MRSEGVGTREAERVCAVVPIQAKAAGDLSALLGEIASRRRRAQIQARHALDAPDQREDEALAS